MKPGNRVPSESSAEKSDPSAEAKLDNINQNVETILAFYAREEQKISRSQRVLEHVSDSLGKPSFLSLILLFVALWILINLFGHYVNIEAFDPPPFHLLSGIIALGALMTSTVVLIKQNRSAKLEEQRAHLDLQINLLTEQKVTKIINLMEELRHDLPMVKDRHDPEVTVLQAPTDPHEVLAALDEHRETSAQQSSLADEGNENRAERISKI